MKRKDSSSESDCVEEEPIRQAIAMDDEAGGSVRTFKGRPKGSRIAKEDHKIAKLKELTMRAQVAITLARTAAIIREAEIIEEQNMRMLFTPPGKDLTPDAIEWLRLRRLLELKKLKKKSTEAPEATEWMQLRRLQELAKLKKKLEAALAS